MILAQFAPLVGALLATGTTAHVRFTLSGTPGSAWKWIMNFWTQPFFHLGDAGISLSYIAKVLVFLVLLAILAGQFRRLLRRHLLDRLSLEQGQRFALESAAGYGIFVLGLAIGLQTSGVDLSTLAVLGGAVGIGIGLGLQSIANNFISGLILLFERPVKVGDRVEVANLMGDVIHIGARSTWVRTNDNIVVVLPNGEFIDKPVVNWTANDRLVRIHVPVGVSYSADPVHVRTVLLRVAGDNQDVVSEPAPDVLFEGFGDSSLNFDLRVWTKTRTSVAPMLRSELYFAIFAEFAREGIEIPFPQRDLHLRTLPASLTLPAQ
ncbi:MAG: mechanosensitive ion channel [Bryobacteraceae bacterium]|nr:mechanosensitive ion channel [Bryobacteraceae bacterium]